MADAGHFRVEPRLIHILGAQYRSTEEALKELIANAWDADATSVDVVIPEPLTGEPIVVEDDGYGMTPQEIASAYLTIAYDRRRAGGDRTPKGRLARGYRGIGKFAGLIAADVMTVLTVSRNVRTRLVLNRTELEALGRDLEETELQLDTEYNISGHGTKVELSWLRPTFALPTRESLGRVLLQEFGRNDDFRITINGHVLSSDVLQGEHVTDGVLLSTGDTVACQIWFLGKPGSVRDPGLLIRVRDRAIGGPTFFGLDRDSDISKSLLRRIYGEVRADHLEEAVLANWSGFIENSTVYQKFMADMGSWLKQQLLSLRDAEAGTAPEEFVASYEEEIQRLPVPRREQARHALLRVFKRFYGEAEERKDAVAKLVLDAMEMDEYWSLVKRIDETPHDDVLKLASLLEQWGLHEVGEVVYQARRRIRALEAFEALIRDESTLELSGVHRGLRDNAWLLGDQYELLKSNRTLRNVIEDLSGSRYNGDAASKRPDLFLVSLQGRYLIVELKRPTYMIDHRDVAQALIYRDQIRAYYPSGHFDVIVIGGSVDPHLDRSQYRDVVPRTYREVVQEARSRLDWLVQNLAMECSAPHSDHGVSTDVLGIAPETHL